MIKFGIVFADIHVGSKFSAWSPNVPVRYGSPIPPTPKQQWCNDRLRDIEAKLKEISQLGSIEWIVFNGDTVDGSQKGWKAFEAVTTFIPDQVKAAHELLSPIASLAKKVYFIIGTEFHDADGGANVEGLAQKLNAVPDKEGQSSRWQLFLESDHSACHFSHYIGTSQIPFYRGTQLAREGMLGALAVSKGIPKLTFIFRSHNHYFNAVQHSSQTIVSTPALQLQTPYQISKSPFGFLPEIGFIVVEERDDLGPWQEWTYLHKFDYKLPPPTVERV